ncbi:helicase associated domain-containing protein [Streptomyces albidoflavus]|uniref:helicase associated domain-containing protein n=1 Tax=Streptomyces albidoflavus TaxID=1886 RepID=UPI0030F43AB1
MLNRTSLPKWKNGDVAAYRKCVGYRVSYTYPDCGHTVKITPEAAKKHRRCWECQNRWWQENEPRLKAELSAAAKAAAGRAGKLVDTVALPADMPAPLATEWRWWAAKLLQGAIAAEEKMGKEGRTDEVLALVTEMAARLTPTKEKAGRVAATDGMLRLLNHTGDSSAAALQDWAHGWAKLKAFTEREGHARVPYEHKEGAFPLGNWVAEQRRVFGAGQMTGLHPPAGEARHGLERVGGELGVFLSNSKSRRAKLTVDKLAALAAPRTGMGDG